MVPNSGAESDTDTYSAPVFCENRFQPAPSSKPFLRLTTRKSGSLSFALRALGMIEIGAVTFSVASVPSMVPSDFAVRLAIVAMIQTASVARGPSPRAPNEGVGRRRPRSAAKGEPQKGEAAHRQHGGQYGKLSVEAGT